VEGLASGVPKDRKRCRSPTKRGVNVGVGWESDGWSLSFEVITGDSPAERKLDGWGVEFMKYTQPLFLLFRLATRPPHWSRGNAIIIAGSHASASVSNHIRNVDPTLKFNIYHGRGSERAASSNNQLSPTSPQAPLILQPYKSLANLRPLPSYSTE